MLNIRKQNGVITYANNMDDLLSIILVYNGGDLTIGDICRFTRQMRRVLYVFLESNPNVNLYSTKDINDELLMSRMFGYDKSVRNKYVQAPFEGDFTYEDAEQLDIRDDMKLRMVNTRKFVRDLCQNL